MATLTANAYLDDAARTSNEAFVLNGATLTIRTDTRWHANSPASMTGAIGAITGSTSLGSGYVIDGTKVRWLAYDTGSGNVPAVGTTITQGGVSGYILGVWADYTSAPTAVGASMPTTGFIKFREVTGGNYSAGALTGIGANATGADTTGWIEVAAIQLANITLYKLGYGVEYKGDWFYLDNTNGSRGQIIQCPTNGGGNDTTILGVEIETSP